MPTPPTSGYEKSGTPEPTPAPSNEPELDENGYEKIPTPDSTPAPKEDPAPPADDNKDDKDEVKTNVTGYGDEPPKTDDKKDTVEDKNETPEDEKTDEQKAAEALEKEIDESLGKLPEGFDKDVVKKFATDNKFTKEQVEAYVEFAKADIEAQNAANKQAIADQRKAWNEELKNDAEFGGDNFNKSIDTVEKFLDKHMPNMKKVLTERGSMLPPYIMKDFLKLSKVLNPTTNFEGGEPPAPQEEPVNFLDEMYQ